MNISVSRPAKPLRLNGDDAAVVDEVRGKLTGQDIPQNVVMDENGKNGYEPFRRMVRTKKVRVSW
jgi:hypothetical protein